MRHTRRMVKLFCCSSVSVFVRIGSCISVHVSNYQGWRPAVKAGTGEDGAGLEGEGVRGPTGHVSRAQDSGLDRHG